MRETKDEIRQQIKFCLEDAIDYLARYELALLTMAEHVLWLIGLDLIITAQWNEDGFVISVDARDDYDMPVSEPGECLEDILNEFVSKHDPKDMLAFRFWSNVVLSQKEAELIRKRLGLRKWRAVRHENGKQTRKQRRA